MTAVAYLEGMLRDHRGEQECILILSTAESLPQMPWSGKKLRKVYPVWCSLLPQQTPIKKLRKKLGGPSKFFRGPDPRISPVVAPMLLMLPQRCDQLLEIERCYWARYARFTSPARHDNTVLSVSCLVYRSHRLKRQFLSCVWPSVWIGHKISGVNASSRLGGRTTEWGGVCEGNTPPHTGLKLSERMATNIGLLLYPKVRNNIGGMCPRHPRRGWRQCIRFTYEASSTRASADAPQIRSHDFGAI